VVGLQYLDEDLSPRVAQLLRQSGLDAVSAHEAGHGGRLDLKQLRFATNEERCLVTRNVADFVEIVRDLVNRQEAHAGIILVPASFRGNEFAVFGGAIAQQAAAYPEGLAGRVIFLRRPSGRAVARASFNRQLPPAERVRDGPLVLICPDMAPQLS
jgi:hypothetical protein